MQGCPWPHALYFRGLYTAAPRDLSGLTTERYHDRTFPREGEERASRFWAPRQSVTKRCHASEPPPKSLARTTSN
ncbi:hypothetical protein VDGE_30765 [Verticillium dahliae]|uniref:Uncharacterized protein n=1 Tax=Verticillium dahliae TaxID=27337 RepID=A0A444S9Z5_VERDA|nr:hypothetical protein VDGE_30765 [Verticillium dahliae]